MSSTHVQFHHSMIVCIWLDDIFPVHSEKKTKPQLARFICEANRSNIVENIEAYSWILLDGDCSLLCLKHGIVRCIHPTRFGRTWGAFIAADKCFMLTTHIINVNEPTSCCEKVVNIIGWCWHSFVNWKWHPFLIADAISGIIFCRIDLGDPWKV